MRSAPCNPRAGVTLVELLVVLLIVGLTAGVAGMSVSALRPPPGDDLVRHLRRARATAIRQATPVRVTVEGPERGGPAWVLRFLPDGRVLGPGVDPWTGAVLVPHAERPQ
jgi:prepilin-type N-terminal cleavage/methylation domain-containing protein